MIVTTWVRATRLARALLPEGIRGLSIPRVTLRLYAVICMGALSAPCTARAQTDTTRGARLDAVVVTADRLASSMASATSAVWRIGSEQLQASAAQSVADVLRLVPGITFVDFDGAGRAPQIVMRGFYGGGEAEYVLLLLDGRPLNAPENGLVTWDQIPLAAIESIEIVRGGASAAWGDAALAGVINVRTNAGAGQRFRGALEMGSFGEFNASFADSFRSLGRNWSGFANFSSLDGFRDHAERRNAAVGATVKLVERSNTQLSATTSHDWRNFDEPGSLTGQQLELSRTQSSPYFRYDAVSDRSHRAGMELLSVRPSGATISARLGAEFRHSDRIRTLPLAPDFADTKNRVLGTTALSGSVQRQTQQLLLGVDVNMADLRSRYFNFTQGDEDAYAGSNATRGALDARGEGVRTSAAGYAVYSTTITTDLRATVGTRLDWLQDTFNAMAPSEEGSSSATHVAFSPKVGANWRYAAGTSRTGNFYVNVGRSFKAPTQDQLFDQRGVPVPFPPFSITFANNELKPQYGINYEAGIYHGATLVPSSVTADVMISAYQMDLRDELDFDLATFRYQNIGRSRHRGVETAVTINGPHTLRLFGNYALQAPESRSGDHSGKYLKAIPRHTVSAGVGVGRSDGLTLNATNVSASGAFLDEANETTLPSWSRWDLRIGYVVAGFTVTLDVLNVLDARYSTTGFPDPSGSGAVNYYPAAGRAFRIGIR